MLLSMESPLIFEILNAPQHIKIYKNGKVEGVDKHAIIANWLGCHCVKCQQGRSPKKKKSIASSSGLLHGDDS